MNDSRDQSIERLLRRSLRADGASSGTGSCLDAETLAAWADEGLGADERAAAETHLSQCARCQMMLATFVRSDVPEQAEQERPWRRWGFGWLVPLAAGAAAVAIWIAVPRQGPPAPANVVQSTISKPQMDRLPQAESQPAAPKLAELAPPQTSDRAAAFADPRAGAREEVRQEAAADARAAAQPAAPATVPAPAATVRAASAPRPAAADNSAPAAPSSAAETMARAGTLSRLDATATVVASPDPKILWRIGAGRVLQYSNTGGQSWETLATGVDVELTAGASPGASVCWLVGRSGTVLRTIDGRRFQRVTFPEPADLAGVQSTSEMAATVTTSDGRAFRTSDGGTTWNAIPLQDF